MVAKVAMMRKVLFLICAGLICQQSLAVQARVKYIVDGDTFIGDVLFENDINVVSVSIRLRNVDTPELHGQCEEEIRRAELARQRLGELIPVGSIVEIDNIKNDKYAGRIDANVYDANNRDIGRVLVREKFGREYSGGHRQPWCDTKKQSKN
jgi:endonuclease YncB( thermonuclease family)